MCEMDLERVVVMALKRVTMQDIADACGLSRNTVSKAFNGRGSVPESTRRTILEKARELGYYQRLHDGAGQGSIALLTQHKLRSHNFGTFFVTSFTDQICRAGYTIKIFEVSRTEIAEKRLPPHFKPAETAGVLGIELFDREYLEMICALKKPTIFVDGFARVNSVPMNCDFVSMENSASETALMQRLLASGARRIGFVGDCEHCNSFYERWLAYVTALGEAGLPLDRRLCILEEDSDSYGDADWLLERLDAMPGIPDAFACANDYLAIHLMAALKKRGLNVPGDVMVTGFDGSPEAAVVSPTLTTARIPSAEIGRLAASLLCERIQFPDAPFRWTCVKTEPVWGESVR